MEIKIKYKIIFFKFLNNLLNPVKIVKRKQKDGSKKLQNLELFGVALKYPYKLKNPINFLDKYIKIQI